MACLQAVGGVLLYSVLVLRSSVYAFVPSRIPRHVTTRQRGWRTQEDVHVRNSLRMDDEIARKGIKEELTTRDEYLATRFTKLSKSQHDLTPFTLAETQDAASHLSPSKKAVLLEAPSKKCLEELTLCITATMTATALAEVGATTGIRASTRAPWEACPSLLGWKLEPRPGDACASFAEPCDDEHVVQEHDSENGVTYVSCARSRLRIGRVVDDSGSPSGKRYLICSAALEFHPLGKALPVRCQPENYWGSEGQYRAWVLE